MLEIKKITLEDRGIKKQFTITAMGAVQALKLLRELLPLLSSIEFVHSVILQQFIHKAIGSGVKVEGASDKEYNELMEKELPIIISYLVQSACKGLNDSNLELLIAKCMDSVVYHNGTTAIAVTEALQQDIVKDFAVVITLMYEVFMLNFGEAIERVKKFLGHDTTKTVIS